MSTETDPTDRNGPPAAGPAQVPDEPIEVSVASRDQASVVLPSPRQLAGLIVVAVISYGVVLVISSLRTILVMLLVSLFISFAMEPAVQFLGRRWGWRRPVATAVVFLVSLVILAGMFASIIPLLVDQVVALLRAVPSSVAELNDLLDAIPFVDVQLDPDGEFNQELLELGGDLTQRLEEGFSTVAGGLLGAAGNVVNLASTAVGLVFQLLTVALVSFYLVADGPKFRATLARPLPPHRQRELLAIWEVGVAKTGGYIYSRVLLAGVAAALTSAFLALIEVPYPLPIGLFVGATSAFVPVIGTYLGGVLAILVALTNEPLDAVWVLIFLIVYQQAENYWFAPKVQSATMDVHPAVAFVSVIVGGTLLGAVGALLALPATAIIQAVVSTYINRFELIDELNEVSSELEAAVPQLGHMEGLFSPGADQPAR